MRMKTPKLIGKWEGRRVEASAYTQMFSEECLVVTHRQGQGLAVKGERRTRYRRTIYACESSNVVIGLAFTCKQSSISLEELQRGNASHSLRNRGLVTSPDVDQHSERVLEVSILETLDSNILGLLANSCILDIQR